MINARGADTLEMLEGLTNPKVFQTPCTASSLRSVPEPLSGSLTFDGGTEPTHTQSHMQGRKQFKICPNSGSMHKRNHLSIKLIVTGTKETECRGFCLNKGYTILACAGLGVSV